MNAEDSHFQSAKKDFEILKRNKQIPPQMETKLQYLLSRIQKRPTTNYISENLPEYQKNSLDQLNLETGTHLFCNIVNCLSGKQIVLYFRDEKAFLRKDQLFAMWKQCWITCDSSNVLIRKKLGEKPSQIFQLVNLRISKNFKVYKKKHVFGACYNKKKNYLIGFDLQSSCARIHQLLRGLIRQKVNKLRNKLSSETLSQTSQISVSRLIQPKITVHNAKQQQQKVIQTVEIEEEREEDVDQNSDKGVVVQFIKQQQINGDSMYKLLKTQENIRQLVNKNYANRLKTELILSKPKLASNIFDYYIKMNEWNPEIQQCNIKIKLSDNSYLVQLKVKKYSYMSWPRQTVLLVTGLMYKNKYYLVLRSTGEDCSYSDTVKMEWNQIIQICQSQDKVLVSFVTELDFKGYSSLDDSQRMGLKVIDNLKLFTKFFQSKQISGKAVKLFNLVPKNKIKLMNNNKDINPMKKKPHSLDVRVESIILQPSSEPLIMAEENLPKIRKMSNNSQFQVPDDQQSKSQASMTQVKNYNNRNNNNNNNKQLSQSQKIQNDPASFSIYMLKDGDSEVSQKLIQLVRLKAYQKYYLKHKFDQNIHLDVSRLEHTAQGPNNYILQNNSWKINQQEDLVFINNKQMQIQKDIIKMIIKQLGSNILSGKSVMNMSLPVQIFDHRTILERVALGLGYAPKFLIPASQTEDIIEQAKFLTLFFLGIGPLHVCMQKPFNPILGQTFQCKIGGIPLYLQQVSHHPPISAVLMKNEKFVLHGAFHSHAQMGLNRVTGRNLSPLYADFPQTNTFYEAKLPQMQISGLIHGQKKYRGQGRGYLYERTNNIFIQWSVGKDKKKVYPAQGKVKPNDLFGGIYTVTSAFGKRFKQCQNKQKFEGLKPEDIIQTHVKITGHWCFDIFFNGVKVKSMSDPLPNKIQYPEFTLPSDSNFRLDLLYKRMENLKASNQQKQIMENIQRRDRKLRQGKLKA